MTINHIAIIKLDAIGDYILIRNFLHAIKNTSTFPNSKITLVGTNSINELVQEFDKDVIHEFINIDKQKFFASKGYRRSIKSTIQDKRFDLALNPCFSRTWLSDIIIHQMISPKKIGWRGDCLNINPIKKWIGNWFYTELLSDSNFTFEFERNRDFFQRALNADFSSTSCRWGIAKDSSKYAIISLGSSSPFRRWSTKKYAQLARLINESLRLNIILVGGQDCLGEEKKFENEFHGEYQNLIGKTSLPELISLAGNSAIAVSNDSSFAHICVATETPVIVISNGNHLNRFVPYPKELSSNYKAIFPPEMNKMLPHELSQLSQNSTLNIETIEVEDVWSECKRLYEGSEKNL